MRFSREFYSLPWFRNSPQPWIFDLKIPHVWFAEPEPRESAIISPGDGCPRRRNWPQENLAIRHSVDLASANDRVVGSTRPQYYGIICAQKHNDNISYRDKFWVLWIVKEVRTSFTSLRRSADVSVLEPYEITP